MHVFKLFAATLVTGLLLLATAASAQWTKIPFPYENPKSNLVCLATDGAKIYAAANDTGIFVSTDHGDTWRGINETMPGDSYRRRIYGLQLYGGDLYASISEYGVCKYNGSAWSTTKELPLRVRADYCPFAIAGGYLFFAIPAETKDYARGIYRRPVNDDTSLWTQVSKDLAYGTKAIAASGSLVLAGDDGYIFRSTNSGDSWTRIRLGYLTELMIVGPIALAGTFDVGLQRSTDSGLTWTPVRNGIPKGEVISIAASGATVVVSVYSQGVYLSRDTGVSFTPISEGLSLNERTFVNPVALSERYIYGSAVDKGAVALRRSLSDFNSEVAASANPGPSLSVYPNPATSELSVALTVESATTAHISLVNILGESVGDVHHSTLRSGTNTIQWSRPSNTPPGVYYIHIQVADQVLNRRVVLLP